MSSEAIIFPNLNYGSFNPATGAFTAQMLCAALGLSPGATNQIGTAVDRGLIAAPDFKLDNNPTGWLWYSSTVQTYMTAAAATTIRNGISAAYEAGYGR